MATTKHSRLMAMLAITCVLAGCVGAFVVPPKVAQATFPGQNGRIAYSAYDGNDYEIYTINPTGGTPFQVTDNNVDDRRPAYSPDGNKIAYESGWQIYTIDSTGGTPVQLTDVIKGAASWPDYSPDGNKIAYSAYSGNDEDIYTIDSTGGTPFNVTNNDDKDDRRPSYSPDGNKIAYASSRHDQGTASWQIYTIDSSGGTPFQVTNNKFTGYMHPSYSPDGNKIAYDASDGNDYEIYTIDASGGSPVQVTDNHAGDWLPSYSPDGNKLAYAVLSGSDYKIYTIDASGGTPFQVTDNSAEGWSAPSWGIATPDTTKPSTNATRSVEPNTAGWNKANVSVNLNATDNQGGSGVQKITYAASGAQSIAQTDATGDSAQVALDQQGTTTLTYYATDRAGNVEDQKTLTVKIDRSAPTVSETSPLDRDTGVAPSANVTATFSEKMDPLSISKSTFKLFKVNTNGTQTQITNVTVALSTDGLKATLNPFGSTTTHLARGTKYKGVITTGAKDVAGNPLDQNTTTAGLQQKAWSFTTAR